MTADRRPGRLADAFRRWRLRRVGDPAFQRWAATFPLTRPIAQRKARELFDLCAGFVYSQVLYACVELRLLERLRQADADVTELAPAVELPLDSCRRLLAAAAALGLTARVAEDRYALGEQGAALLANPGVLAMIRHHRLLYADLADPVGLLRDPDQPTALGRFWAYAKQPRPEASSNDEVAAYTDLMAASQQLIADDVLDAYPVAGHRCLLDVAGGDGSFLRAAAARAPALRLMLLDLPAVAEQARARFAAAGLASRVEVIGRSFADGPLPTGADLISLVRVLHDHDDAPAQALLRAIRLALPPGGRLLLAEPLAGTPGAERVGDAYFGFYLLAMGSGRARRADVLTAWLKAAGFGRVRHVRTRRPLQVEVLVAEA